MRPMCPSSMGYAQGEDMNTEDEEFNRIEREATMRLNAVAAALKDHAENLRSLQIMARPYIPDALTASDGETPEYMAGWNDCRATLLGRIK
jgi:hypothetical protein